MPAYTKICSCASRLTVSPAEPNSPSSKLWREFAQETANTPGYRSFFYGYRKSSVNVLQWMIEWTGLEEAMKFRDQKTPAHDDIFERLKPAILGPMSVFHVAFAPHGPDAVVTAALTELVFLYIPTPGAPPKGQEQDAAQARRLAMFTEASRSKIREVEAVTGGWAVEVVEHNGQAVRVFVVLVGWRSEAAHASAVNRPETQTAFKTLAGPAVDVQRETVPFLVPA